MLISPVLQSFAAVIQHYMTMDQASKGGRQALLTMASKPCMHEVRRQVATRIHCLSDFSWELHATRASCEALALGRLVAFSSASTLLGCLTCGSWVQLVWAPLPSWPLITACQVTIVAACKRA